MTDQPTLSELFNTEEPSDHGIPNSGPTQRTTLPDDVPTQVHTFGTMVCREVPVPGRSPLYLGNGTSTDPEAYHPEADTDDAPANPEAFSHVVSMNKQPYSLTTDHHPLNDGPGNSDSEFDAAVEAARRAYRAEEGPVLINCAAGISRSTTVMAATVAAENPSLYTFASAVEHIRDQRPHACPAKALQRHAHRYLRENAPEGALKDDPSLVPPEV
jgi:hypothetical protein